MRSENTVREGVLRLLSEEEIARVSTVEMAVRLEDGDEYLDLEHPSHGVQRASGATTVIGSVLPRRAVRESAWKQILLRLEPPRGAAARPVRPAHEDG